MTLLNWIKDFYCDGCESPFPKSALIGIHGERYCITCSQSIDKSMYFCDGCGEDYPLHHLEHDEMFDGYFCRRCK
jgi:hypothetical protein